MSIVYGLSMIKTSSIKMLSKSSNRFHIYDFTGGSISLACPSCCPPCHPNDATTAAPSTAVGIRSLGSTQPTGKKLREPSGNHSDHNLIII